MIMCNHLVACQEELQKWNSGPPAALIARMSAKAPAFRGSHQAKSRKNKRGSGITDEEVQDVEELATPRTPVIYEVVRRLGEEEMLRPATSLWWSGLAAGLSISFSLLAQAILETHLPDVAWRSLVSSFGYSVGFIMVVLSRQQFFTENTLTVVLPVMAEPTLRNLALIARIW